jgi:Protein of unknown function (DUF3349)
VSETTSTIASRVLQWLRAGYPAGVPKQDYVVLLGLLRRKLTDVEVHRISTDLAELAAAGEDITVADVEQLINQTTLDATADPDDVARVSARLAAGGWPLDETPLR